jgi:phosphoribosyl-ATP pyrophosphohydrolase
VIVPSIDVMGGQAVQLVGGERPAILAGDPRPWMRRFSIVGEVAVIDIDAARGEGSNVEAILPLLSMGRCRVGGGIRDYEAAARWLDAGAERVILGTAARPELIAELPAGRVVAALDSLDGEVVVRGWRERTGRMLAECFDELREAVSGFLVTFVESEGREAGIDMGRVREAVEAARPARVTVAGGVTTAEEVAAIDAMGADCQVGMALYSGKLGLAEAFAAPLRSDRPDGLWPTVVCDEGGRALGLTYSNLESLRTALDELAGVYWSRNRGLWRKGEGSGDRQELLRADVDCDRDTLRFFVRQSGRGFCHLGTDTCWGDLGGVPGLERTVSERQRNAVSGSYTARLLHEPGLLGAKLVEEAGELAQSQGPEHAAAEAADLVYFATVRLAQEGATWAMTEGELDRRARRASRRPGDAKEQQ